MYYYYLYIENDIVLSKKLRSREISFENEVQITENIYNEITIPSKLEGDEYIPCDWDEYQENRIMPEPEEELPYVPTTEELLMETAIDQEVRITMLEMGL